MAVRDTLELRIDLMTRACRVSRLEGGLFVPKDPMMLAHIFFHSVFVADSSVRSPA
jgi:hypothetical protein